MPDDPIPPAGGATGEPAPQAAVSSQPSDADLLASLDDKALGAPDPDAEFWKAAAEKDFSKAPPELRAKVEAPFLSQFNKKTTELDHQRKEEQDRWLSVLERFMVSKGQPSVEQPDMREELRQKLADGDVTAVEGLMERMFQERYGPQMNYISNKQAIETAAQLMPELPKYDQQVASILTNDKNLLYLASINNRQFAPQVLAGLAFQLGYQELKGEIVALKDTIAGERKKAVEDYKAQLRGLPTSTSQAGKTPTAFPPEKPMTPEQIRDTAWDEATAAARARGH